jgi:hypothetical protein
MSVDTSFIKFDYLGRVCKGKPLACARKIDNPMNREKGVFGKMNESERLILLLKSLRKRPCNPIKRKNL